MAGRAQEVVARSEALHARVRAFAMASLAGPPADPGNGGGAFGPAPPRETFDEIAIAIARFQADHVPAVARLFGARGRLAASIRRAGDIPAMPCDAFRFSRIAAHPPELDVRTFRTSGTSQGPSARGEHPMRTTATYELVALAWGRRLLWPDGTPLRVIVLAPPVGEAADSSLGFMLDRFAAALPGPATWHVRGARLDVEGVAAACDAAREDGRAALVLGTSFAFVHLLDALRGRKLPLPSRSRVMQTGGFKGRSREVPAAELRAAIREAFGVPEAFVASEYGMTELSSQLYEGALARALGAPVPGDDARGGRTYLAPPWLRVEAVDPESLEPVAPASVGIARITDLANVDSAVVVQTSDRVCVDGRGVTLLGRAAGAPPRGCSIAMDTLLGRAGEEAPP